jgi:CRP/FNR family transcriptional regulator
MIEEPSQLLSIDYVKFKKNYIDTGILSREIAFEILQQSQQLQSIINREFIFDSVSKVAMMLDDDVEIFNRLKRYDASLMLHIQPATLSRVLNRLKRDEIIDIQKGNVMILDTQKLQNIYKGCL